MFDKQMKALLFSIGCIFSTQGLEAVEYQNGQYIWSFASGEAWPYGYNQNTGKPENLIYAANEYPSDFFERINNALPEMKVNDAFLTGDEGSNITLVEEAEVFITFLHEGAGYKNSFGYFLFDKNNPPVDINEIRETIVFPNLSYPHLAKGHRVNLGTFPAGTSIGFFIAANGFWYYTGVKPFASPFYYSLKDLNPDPDHLKQHNVLLLDEEVDEVIIGFEDLPRSWGDNDFNDAVFSVKTTPSTAIAREQLTTMPEVDDADADGISDVEDEFPNDYTRAFSSYFPTSEDWVTLAFEDNWPNVGDYDLNDLVVRERLQTIYNSSGDISGFKITGFIDARGAAKHNGFGLRLMGLSPEIIGNSNLTISGQIFEKYPEENQSEAVIILWQDSHAYTQTGETGSCSHFNTNKECSEFSPIPFEMDVKFNFAPTSLNHSSLDFFLFRKNYRGREIHFADYPPTDLFDFSQLGKVDDTSDTTTGRFFRSANNLPWALKVHSNWCYPREYIDVVWAYPDYELWVESSGEYGKSWFNSSPRNTHYFCRDDNQFGVEERDLPPSNIGRISCELNYVSQADGSYQLDVLLSNHSTVITDGWEVDLLFNTTPLISQSWGGNVVTENTVVTITHLPWNKFIDAGENTSFGFQGNLNGAPGNPSCVVK